MNNSWDITLLCIHFLCQIFFLALLFICYQTGWLAGGTGKYQDKFSRLTINKVRQALEQKRDTLDHLATDAIVSRLKDCKKLPAYLCLIFVKIYFQASMSLVLQLK